MAEVSKIEWCDSTFNPWVGCTKVSPACDHCYAEAWAKRSGDVKWGQPGERGERRRTSVVNWQTPYRWDRQRKVFFAEHGKRRRVFCASLADVFDNQAIPEWRSDLWQLIRSTSNLDWLLLTKRPQNIKAMLPDDWGQRGYHNVWLGTTAEDQKRWDENLYHLSQVAAVVRFVSVEPMLERIDAGNAFDEPDDRVDWVIAGGESGGKARYTDPEWFRWMRDQCKAARVPFFMKQMTKKAPIPDDLMVREFPA